MKYKTSITFILILLSLSLDISIASAGWLFGPSNYSECIKEYVSAAKSETAATVLAYSCKNEFKENKTDKNHQKYYKCVREGLEGVESDTAARVIAYDCKNKYLK